MSKRLPSILAKADISQASEWRPHGQTDVAAAPARCLESGATPKYQEAGLGEVIACRGHRSSPKSSRSKEQLRGTPRSRAEGTMGPQDTQWFLPGSAWPKMVEVPRAT